MHRILPLFLLAALIPGGAPASTHARDPHERYAPPPPRAAQVVSPMASARLDAEGTSALWVYFIDKGETDERSFARAVDRAGARVGAASRLRRAREMGGRFVPDWYDVPVVPSYVDGVRSTGATIRHVSRWINAVSVMADRATVARIASLPYVGKIAAVSRGQRIEPVGPVEPAPEREPQHGAAQSLEEKFLATSLGPPTGYGGSSSQMNFINAKAAQDSGYTGAGVVVAMFDTGYDKSHAANAPHPRLAEYDFVFGDTETANQANDQADQWVHGTGTWAVLGGFANNSLIGPAYNASFLLAKTEDNRSETPVEEDNWLAAVQWADSIGCDVISSSLGYSVFDSPYPAITYSMLDGKTSVVTRAAALAARRGIVVSSAMGNSGPNQGSLTAPADADSILSVGATDSLNVLAGFSGRGPTFDGRGKPEIVAMGVQTLWAVAGSGNLYARVNGTSLSTPLIGGAAAQVREAHPEWTVQQIRYALKLSGDKAATPDSMNFGWGRPNVVKAIYGTVLGPPVFPKPFNLVSPANNSTIGSPPFTFVWRRTADPNGDAVTYRLRVLHQATSTIVYDATTTDTTLSFGGYLFPGSKYTWYVSASDPAGHERESRDRYALGVGSSTGVEAVPPASGFVLYPNRPNPVRTSTRIPFAIGSAGGSTSSASVTLRIYDASGRLVRTLIENDTESLPAVRYQPWDGRDEKGHRVGSGIYYYRLTVSGREVSRRMVVVR